MGGQNNLERYGGEADFKENLQKMFHNTTRFWNESPNKFNYYFRFVPAGELCVYDIQGDKDRYKEFQRKASALLICPNTTLCCFWRWERRMKGFPVEVVEPADNR